MNLSVLILPAALVCSMNAFRRSVPWRESVLRGLLVCGFAVAIITEIMSLFGLLRRGPLLGAWLCFSIAMLLLPRSRPKMPSIQGVTGKLKNHFFEFTMVAAIASIAVIVGWIAILSPPNSADAMAYHMPRVVYWAQAGSVAFFPTHYFNQIMLQPFTEYAMLHSYVLSGADCFVNLVQFVAFLGSVIGVSSIVQALGVGARGQVFAAVFCATLPNGILQASGAKNDYVLALWLVCLVYYAVRVVLTPSRTGTALLGLSAGLALAAKATAYLFAPPMLLAILF